MNDACMGLGPVVSVLKNVVRLFQILIPIGLILYGMLDLGKAVIASKEDEMKAAQKTLIKRVIYAAVVFLLVFIVEVAMGMVGSNDWKKCWNGYGKTQISDAE